MFLCGNCLNDCVLGWWMEYALDYCYVQNTYFVPFFEKKVENAFDFGAHMVELPSSPEERQEKQIGQLMSLSFFYLSLSLSLQVFFPLSLYFSLYTYVSTFLSLYLSIFLHLCLFIILSLKLFFIYLFSLKFSQAF